MSLLSNTDIETMGTDLTSSDRERAWGYNHANVRRKEICFYESDSAWWYDGGTAFVRNRKLARLLYYCYKLFNSVSRSKFRRTPMQTLSNYIRDTYSYGSLPISRIEAEKEVTTFIDTLEEINTESVTLDKETKEQLREMGYLT
jgi:homogentisate 1,2-dioxygenase